MSSPRCLAAFVILSFFGSTAAFAFGKKPIEVIQGTPRPTELVTTNVFRGSRPASEAAVAQLARIGIKTVINLQGGASIASVPGEKPAEIQEEGIRVQRQGMRYYNLPISTLTSLSSADKARVIQITAMMDNPQLQPVFVHCSVGVDRTGLVVAAYRILYQGCTFRKSYDELLRIGKPWTIVVTASQISFLQNLEKNQRAISGSLRQRCPL